MAELLTNPLAELEGIYLNGDWDRAFRRAASSSRANLDLIRILIVMAGDMRRTRELLEDRRVCVASRMEGESVGRKRE